MKRIAFVSLTLFTALAACGDDEIIPPGDDEAPDASVEPDGGATIAPGKIAVVAGDFNATGVLSTVEAPSMTLTPNAVAGVASPDPLIRRVGDELFVVNRFGGHNVTIVDATTLTLADQIATGDGSNPQDVAVVGDKLYVPVYGGAGVAVIDRADSNALTTIDLADLDANDDLPNCQSAYAVGTRVFVTCQLLDGFAVAGPGKVVVIDSADDSVETSFDLPTPNPQGMIQAIGGDLYVSGYDYADTTTGCLAKITTGTTPTASCVVDNADTAGWINHIAAADGVVFAAVNWSTAEPPYAEGTLHTVDLATGALGASLLEAEAVPRDLTVCGDFLFLVDKATGTDGLRVFQIDAGAIDEETATAMDIGLPPGIGDGIACMNAAQ
jgi:hypothetical protein